jgi:hypothetical protein
MESQDLTKENEKLGIVVRTTVAENVKKENHHQILLKEKERVTCINTKLTADA